MMYFKEIEKPGRSKSRISRRKEMIKIIPKLKKLDTHTHYKGSTKPTVGFLKR